MNRWVLLISLALVNPAVAQSVDRLSDFATVNDHAQQRSVKIYGAGGLQQLEAYQSGFIVSAEGHVVTVASVVLDRDSATVHLASGDRLEAEVVGVDPLLEIALLKLDSEEANFPYFELEDRAEPYPGMRVLAFSNLYNVATGQEPVSVLHGVISVIAPLEARRGAFATRYRGDVYVLDAATNNPGAPGGVLLDWSGRPLGMLGKELKSEITGTWFNYAMPWQQVKESVDRIRRGDLGKVVTVVDQLPDNPATFASLGFRLVPNVVARTPPYVDSVLPNSPAERAGIMADDLVISIAGMRTGTRNDAETALRQVTEDQPVRLTLLRGNVLLDVELIAVPGGSP